MPKASHTTVTSHISFDPRYRDEKVRGRCITVLIGDREHTMIESTQCPEIALL
jgi:hypothetical protein